MVGGSVHFVVGRGRGLVGYVLGFVGRGFGLGAGCPCGPRGPEQ